MASLKKKRKPVSATLRARLTPPRQAVVNCDQYIVFDFRPIKSPYWTPEGLVASEYQVLRSRWDAKTRKRVCETAADGFKPALVTGAAIEEMRAQESVR